MDDDTDDQTRWNQVRHDLLNLLLEFHNQWNAAFAISHACGHTKTPDVGRCQAVLDRAWADIDELDDLFRRYKETIGEMRKAVRKISGDTGPERPG